MSDNKLEKNQTKTLDKNLNTDLPHRINSSAFYMIVILLLVSLVSGLIYKSLHKTSNNSNNTVITTHSTENTFNQTVNINTTNLLNAGKYNQALALLKTQSAQPTNNDQKYTALKQTGYVYLYQKNYSQSLSTFLEAYNLEPNTNDVMFLASIAGLYSNEGNDTKAIQFYKLAINQTNNWPGNLYKPDAPTFQATIVSLGGQP